MDTRMHMVLRDLKDDAKNATAWTPYNSNMQRRFYKGGAEGELYGGGNETYDWWDFEYSSIHIEILSSKVMLTECTI